jgi:hypothetical protein
MPFALRSPRSPFVARGETLIWSGQLIESYDSQSHGASDVAILAAESSGAVVSFDHSAEAVPRISFRNPLEPTFALSR